MAFLVGGGRMKDLAIIVILICLVGGSLWAVVISPMAEAQADQMQTKNILDIQTQALSLIHISEPTRPY